MCVSSLLSQCACSLSAWHALRSSFPIVCDTILNANLDILRMHPPILAHIFCGPANFLLLRVRVFVLFGLHQQGRPIWPCIHTKKP